MSLIEYVKSIRDRRPSLIALHQAHQECTKMSDFVNSLKEFGVEDIHAFQEYLVKAIQEPSADEIAEQTNLFQLLKCISRDREAIENLLNLAESNNPDVDVIESVCIRLRKEHDSIAEIKAQVELLKCLNNACYLSKPIRDKFTKSAGISDCVLRLQAKVKEIENVVLLHATKEKTEIFRPFRSKVPDSDSYLYDHCYFNVRLIFIITALDAEQRSIYFKESLLTALFNLLKHCTLLGTENKESQYMTSEMAELSIEILKTLFNLLLAPNGSGALLRERTIFEEVESMVLDNCILCCRHVLNVCAPFLPHAEHALLTQTSQQQLAATLAGHICNLLTMMPSMSLDMLSLIDANNGTRNLSSINAILTLNDYTLACNPCPQHKPTSLGDSTCPADCANRNGNISQESVGNKLPILCLLTQLADTQTNIHRRTIKRHILPKLKEADTKHRPEVGVTTKARLIRLLTCVNDRLRDATAELLYVLCDRNVDKLIKYVGYGNASGMLAARGLLMNDNRSDPRRSIDCDSSDDEEQGYTKLKDRINPVIGCVDNEEAIKKHKEWLDSLSDEQKEYEAHRLMQQIDKLMKEGIIKPATVGEDGKPKEVEHVLQLADQYAKQVHKKK